MTTVPTTTTLRTTSPSNHTVGISSAGRQWRSRPATWLRTLALAMIIGVASSLSALAVQIRIDFGRTSACNPGFGICKITVGSATGQAFNADGVVQGDQMGIDFLGSDAAEEKELPVDHDVVLDDATSRALGYRRVTIKKGTYPVERNGTANGHVDVDVVTERMIVVKVEVGRRDAQGNCVPGFGICSITIGSASAALHAEATLTGTTLSLDFLQQPAERKQSYRLDDFIQLDRATSLALGYKSVRILPGEYTIDYSTNPNGHVDLNVEAKGVTVTIKVGRPSQRCYGFGFCGIEIGLLNSADARASAVVRDGMLDVDLLTPFAEPGTSLEIEEDIVLDDSTSRAFGYGHVTVLKGRYNVDYSSNPNGHVVIPVSRVGITITIEVGRRSKGCNGFGICSITTDLSLRTSRGADAIATAAGGKLQLELLSAAPDRGDVLEIDEDILLDKATSVALGFKEMKILKGSYRVDYSSNPNGSVDVDIQPLGIVIKITTGRASQNCTGFGICSIEIDVLKFADARASASINDGMIDLDYLTPLGKRDEPLVIDEDIVLDEATSHALGYGHVTVLKGSYKVDYSSNPNGHVQIPVSRIGITIGIEIGRRSKGCTGFGVCSITIGVERMSDRGVGAIATEVDGKLRLELLTASAERGDVLEIDEDIVLDAATSRAFGHKQMTILKGSYRVDYSSNPNGQVDVNVEKLGLTISVEVGRRSVNCTKFGVCSITIDVSLRSSRGVGAIATASNGMLELELPSGAPDKSSVLEIDEDIMLDSATSNALGGRMMVVRKGSYPVDYSNDSNGTVMLRTLTASTSSVDNVAGAGNQTRMSFAPNPATGFARINFTLASSEQRVNLTVTDLTGRTVLNLLDNEYLSSGDHTVQIDAGSLAVGSYLYTLRTGATVETGRFQVIR